MTEAAKLRPEEEMLRALLRRADALNAACIAVELEEWGCPAAKARTLETLEEMREQAQEWFVSYRRALGIPNPLAHRDDHEEEDMQRHTVEVTVEGEKVSSVTDDLATYTLYRTDEGTYLVHLDQRKSGEGAALEDGVYSPGLSEHDVQVLFPGLLEAQSGQ